MSGASLAFAVGLAAGWWARDLLMVIRSEEFRRDVEALKQRRAGKKWWQI